LLVVNENIIPDMQKSADASYRAKKSAETLMSFVMPIHIIYSDN
jgi:hypothetical protein